MPISRMQWWMRPGPSRAWAMAKPPPSSPTRFSMRHPDVVEDHLGVAAVVPVVVSEHPHAAPHFEAGVSRGTRIMLCRRCRSAVGSVLPMTMKIAHRGFIAPEMYHLRPLTT